MILRLSVTLPGALMRAAGVVLVGAMVACSDSSPDPVAAPVVAPPVSTVALVTVITSEQSVHVGETVQATASAYDQNGSLLPLKVPKWTVEGDAGRATVDQNGKVTTLASGAIRVVATVDGVRGQEAVVISPPQSAALVRVTLDSTTLLVGNSAQARAAVLDSTGAETPGVPVVWSLVGGPAIASIGEKGTITAIAAGVVRVVASVGKVKGEALLTVVAPSTAPAAQVTVTLSAGTIGVGRTAQAQFVALDTAGVPLVGKKVTWSVAGGAGVASVSASGLVTGIGDGTVSVVARVDSATGEAPVSVVSRASSVVAKVVVSVDSSALAIGSVAQARFVAFDALDLAITGKSASWSIAKGAGVATISSAGLVTGITAGQALVEARVDGVVGTTTLDVLDSATAANAVVLPEGLRDSLRYVYPVPTGRSWTVRQGDDLQAVLNNAQRGDEIVLDAGAVFRGTFTLPAKLGTVANGWILVRSSAQGQLPARGTRVGPAHAPLMPKIVTTNAHAAIQTAPRASGWWLTGLDVTIDASFTGYNYGLVLLGDGTSVQNSMALVPSDLVLDRLYIHASETQATSRCVALNSARTEIDDSYLYDCHAKGFDTQAIAGWNGPGPYRIYNNMLAGAGENVMFGGANPAIPGLVPSDIEIRRNYLYTPASWKGVWTKKNIFELKNAVRVLLEGNVLDGSWIDGQVGFAVMIYSTNQGGNGCRWCRVTDVTMRGNLVRNVVNGFNLSGGQTPVDTATRRLALIGNVLDGLRHAGDGRLVQLLANGRDLTIDSLVAVGGGGRVNQFLVLDPNPAWTNFRFTNSVVEAGTYGLFSSYFPMGEAALAAISGTKVYRNVRIIGAQRPGYPSSTFVSSESQAPLAADIRSRVAASTAGVEIP